MPQGILRECRRLVFGAVIREEFSGCKLDRLPLLFAGFLLDDLAVALLEALALAAFLPYGLVPVRRAGGTSVTPPVQLELVMIELAVFENAHVAKLPRPHEGLWLRNSQVKDLRGRPAPRLGCSLGIAAPPPAGCDSRKAAISPSLYLMEVPLIRRNGQPMFSRRSRWRTFSLHPRMAAYTCSSTHAHGTGGTCVRSTTRGTLLISPPPTPPSAVGIAD